MARMIRAAAPQGPRILRPIRPRRLNMMAQQQAQQQLQAAQAPIISARAAAAQQALMRGQQIQGAGEAMMKLMPDPSLVQKAYSDAAAQTAGVAGAFTGEAGKNLAAAEQKNADFLQQQAPGATPQNEPNVQAGQDASYYLGGYNPASSLIAQGAAAYGTAAGLPEVQQAGTKQDIMANAADAQKNDQQYVQSMLDLAAKEPDMQNQILDHLYQREFQKIQLGIQLGAQNLYQQKFGEQKFMDRQSVKQRNQELQQGQTRLWLQGQGLKLQIAKQNAYLRQQVIQGRRIDASASRAAGYLIDHNGDPILDKRGHKMPVAASSSGGGGGLAGVGSTGYKEAVRAVDTIMPQPTEVPATNPNSASYKYVAQAGKGTFVPGSGWFTNNANEATLTPQQGMPATFADAVTYVMNAYGLKRGAARKALIAGGWKPDGKKPPKTTSG